MMLMSRGAIEALEAQAKTEGRNEAVREMHAIFKLQWRLREVLEVEDGASLLDAAERLFDEVRSHREAMRIASQRIEAQRVTINELRQSLLHHVKETA